MTLAQDLKQPVLAAYIELFEIDLVGIGGSLYRFTNTTDGAGAGIVWNGDEYTPFPIQMTGISHTTDGPEQRPTLTISSIDRIFTAVLSTLDDCVGGTVEYRRTFANYLGTSISSAPQHFIISRKSQHNKNQIAWELKNLLDLDGRHLPAAQMLREGDRAFPGLGINKSST